MALARREIIKACVSVVATSTLTLATAFGGASANRAGESVLPWAIAFFALYAFELPYLALIVRKDVKERSAEEERRRTLAKRRKEAELNEL